MAEGMSLWDYLKREVSYGYLLRGREDIYSEKQQRILTIMRTPRELEKLMLFGVGICFNSFLFIFSFLPIRIIWVGLTFLFRLLTCRRWIDNTHKCDVARVILLIVCTYAMRYVDTSQVYHLVRGQSVIKLYVIFNVLEIFDRLAASIGQDVLDSFYWVLTGSGRGSRKRDVLPLVFYSIVATLYVVTINVAINSHSKALLTVMVSNQFVELKGNVFKKFDDRNLFQMSCSDIRERFHYVVILLIVTIRNLAQFSWNIDHLGVLLPLIVLIFLSEVFVDWIKHGFITKFNAISPNVYQKYSSILAKDLRNRRTRMSPSEYSDLVSRRMGFTPLPLTCVLSQTLITFLEFPEYSGKLCLVIIFLCLLSLKILLGITLLGIACQHKDTPTQDNEPQERTDQTGLIIPPELKHRKTKTSKSQSLSEIERFTLSGNRIV